MTPVLGEGLLLVAGPSLVDPNFFRSVVLLCRYEPSEGTFGLILNRPTKVTLGKALPDAAQGRIEPLWLGGPVDGRCLWVVHRDQDVLDPGIEVLPGVYFGGEPRLVKRLLAANPRDDEGRAVRFYVGYAGWGEGQLESELGEGAWFVVPAGPEMLFNETPDRLWLEMVQRARLIPWDEEAIARWRQGGMS